MSDNNNGWESCMSWDNNGCYRVGTLECMNCENTIVAYIESDTKQYRIGYSDKYWNSKRYRQLVMITDEVIMTNKGYPFNNENLSNEVLNWVAELCGEDFEGENIDYDAYKSYDIEGFNYINVVTDMMYNDTDNESNSFVRLNKNHNKENDVKRVQLGGNAMCLKCGSHCDDEEELICYDCSDKFYCDCCNETCHGEQYSTEDGVVCEYCFENHYATCEECGDSYDREWGRIQYLDEDDLEKYVDGEITTDFPTTSKLEKAKPVLEVLDGWKEDIRGIKNYDELPVNCRKYIEFIEEKIGFPITMVSNGPGREDIIYRNK